MVTNDSSLTKARERLCVDVTIAEQSHTRMRGHQELHSIPLATKKIETINAEIRTLLLLELLNDLNIEFALKSLCVFSLCAPRSQ